MGFQVNDSDWMRVKEVYFRVDGRMYRVTNPELLLDVSCPYTLMESERFYIKGIGHVVAEGGSHITAIFKDNNIYKPMVGYRHTYHMKIERPLC